MQQEFKRAETLPENPYLPGYAFDIQKQIGQGGFAAVYAADMYTVAENGKQRSQGLVALKMQRLDHLSLHEQDEAKQEAKAGLFLRHKNIVPVYAAGIYEGADQQTHLIIATPYYSEGTLSPLTKQPPETIEEIAERVDYVSQIAEALQEAHNNGVLHRDIKAANIFRDGKDHVVVGDFGISHFLRPDPASGVSAPANTAGTPTHMAPEQGDGRPVPASDQYSLAVLAYQLLTGTSPFVRPNALASIMANREEAAPDLLQPLGQPMFNDIIQRALAKHPAQRYRSVIEFAHALQEAVLPFLPDALRNERYQLAEARMKNRPSVFEIAAVETPSSKPSFAFAVRAAKVVLKSDPTNLELQARYYEAEERLSLAEAADYHVVTGYDMMAEHRYGDALFHFNQAIACGSKRSDIQRMITHLSLTINGRETEFTDMADTMPMVAAMGRA